MEIDELRAMKAKLEEQLYDYIWLQVSDFRDTTGVEVDVKI